MFAKQQLCTNARASRFLHFLDVTARLPRETSSCDVFTRRSISSFFLNLAVQSFRILLREKSPRFEKLSMSKCNKVQKTRIVFPTDVFTAVVVEVAYSAPYFRGEKLTDPLFKLFSLLTYFLTSKLMTDRLYYYTSSCPHIKVWYGVRVYTELTKDTSYSTIYHLCMYLKLNLFVELFYIYR